MASKLQYVFVGKEKLVWCEAQAADEDAGAGGNMISHTNTKTATKIMGKLHNDGKYNFNLDASRAAYAVVDKGVCFGCIVDSQITAYTAMSFINETKTKFFKAYNIDDINGSNARTQTKSFQGTMEKTMEKFDGGSASKRKLTKVKSQIEEVKGVMADNIDKVLERGEKLEDVLTKSDQMKDHAMQFKTKGKKLRRMLYCQNLKMKIIIVLVLLGLGFVIFLIACKGFKCVS